MPNSEFLKGFSSKLQPGVAGIADVFNTFTSKIGRVFEERWKLTNSGIYWVRAFWKRF